MIRKRRGTTTDVYGDTVVDTGSSTDVTYSCFHEVRQTTKDHLDPGRRPDEAQHFFIFSPEADIVVTDLLVLGGVELELRGDPIRWDVGFGVSHLAVEATDHRG